MTISVSFLDVFGTMPIRQMTAFFEALNGETDNGYLLLLSQVLIIPTQPFPSQPSFLLLKRTYMTRVRTLHVTHIGKLVF
jgi:hypothetical protein